MIDNSHKLLSDKRIKIKLNVDNYANA